MSNTIKELKQICKKRGIKGYSKLNKKDLIKLIKRQQRLKRNKKIIGGKLINEYQLLGVGSFGWIVTPSVNCKKSNKFHYDQVSKFAIKNDGVMDEIKIGKKLSKIDKSSKYFLYVKESCKINTKKVEKVLETDFTDMALDMEAEGEGPLEFYNLIMDKGDITIQKYFQKYNVGEKTGIKILIKLLKCVKKLLDSGYVHTDFHNENVILKKTNKNKYEFVIIDFGDMANKKDFPGGEQDMLYGVLRKVQRVQGKKFKKLLKEIEKVNTIKESFEIIKESGYDLKMNLEIEKKDSVEKKKQKNKSFFKKIF
jgi:serine/threonine protein kinase